MLRRTSEGTRKRKLHTAAPWYSTSTLRRLFTKNSSVEFFTSMCEKGESCDSQYRNQVGTCSSYITCICIKRCIVRTDCQHAQRQETSQETVCVTDDHPS